MKSSQKAKNRLLRIVGDCGHPWYCDTSELDDEVKSKPLKCPFCECEGAPIYALMSEISKPRMV